MLLEGTFILIKTTTTLSFVTTRCFGGRHDDREIVNDEREGLVMDVKEREDQEGEGREREEKEKIERCIGRGCHEYPIANGRNNICKINGKKEEKWKI